MGCLSLFIENLFYSAFVRVPVRKFCMHGLLNFVYNDDSIAVGFLRDNLFP